MDTKVIYKINVRSVVMYGTATNSLKAGRITSMFKRKIKITGLKRINRQNKTK